MDEGVRLGIALGESLGPVAGLAGQVRAGVPAQEGAGRGEQYSGLLGQDGDGERVVAGEAEPQHAGPADAELRQPHADLQGAVQWRPGQQCSTRSPGSTGRSENTIPLQKLSWRRAWLPSRSIRQFSPCLEWNRRAGAALKYNIILAG